jgi:hypothetical protein
MPVRVPSLRVRQGDPARESREIPVVPGPQQQMPVIPEQTIGQEAHFVAVAAFFQDLLKGGEVVVALEDRHASVGTVEHVINVSTVRRAACSSHGFRTANAEETAAPAMIQAIGGHVHTKGS